jgi:hypothetical protein
VDDVADHRRADVDSAWLLVDASGAASRSQKAWTN